MLTTIVIVYMASMIGIGVFFRKRNIKTSDFLIAGRNLGLLLTTTSLAAIQIGAGVILGGSELGAESGIWPGMWFGIGCGGGLIIAGLTVAKKLRNNKGYVPLDYFGKRYTEKKWIRFWAWLSNIPSLLGIFIAQLMAAGSIFIIFGLSYEQGIIITALVIAIYTIVGGMWGVAATNMIQLAIIVIGIPLVAIVSIIELGKTGNTSIGGLLGSPFIPNGLLSKAIFIIIPFLLAISISYDAYMRYQSAKSAKIAKWGCILGGIFVIFISFCTGIIGSAGRYIFPDIDSAAIMPHMINSLLPPVFAGLVISALLAAAMSTGNCLLLSLSACFTRDFYNKVLHPNSNLDELKQSKNISRLVIAFSLIIGVLIAFILDGILDTIIIFNYPYMASMLVPLLAGVLWKGATTKGAMAAIFVGGTIGIISFLAGIPGPLHGIINADLGLFVAYVASLITIIIASYFTRKEKYILH